MVSGMMETSLPLDSGFFGRPARLRRKYLHSGFVSFLHPALFALFRSASPNGMKKAVICWGICLLVVWPGAVAFGKNLEEKIVTRVDTAEVVLKHKALAIIATGMGRTPTPLGRGGKLVRRESGKPLNKDGLVEYELRFKAVQNYTGFKMSPIRATLTDRSVPEGVKGVRIFGEYNQVDALLPVPEPKKRKSFLPFGKKQKESEETSGSVTGSSPHP